MIFSLCFTKLARPNKLFAMTPLVMVFSLALFNLACSDSGHDSGSSEDLRLEAKADEKLSLRFILKDSDLDSLGNEIGNQGGQIFRKMDFVEALVAQLPEAALEQLKRKFPNLEVFEDVELSLIEPLEIAGKGNGSGGTTVQPAQQVPWGIDRIGARAAQALNRGTGVKVCIVDTGISKFHPDLIDNIVGGRNFITIKGKVDPTQYEDDNGHGSHVAGIVAALDNAIGTVGVAPEAKLYGVKVLNRQGSGYLSDITDGIWECIAAGTQVINMSFGGNGDPNAASPMKSAIEAAIASGIYAVAAAGNEGADISGKTPAGFNGVIAVAATNSSDQFASWSNFGLSLDDYSAPGVSIYSTWKGTGYNTISGTSMAAPHVAGVAALLISSGSLGFVTSDLGYSVSIQGAGLIEALSTVNNH